MRRRRGGPADLLAWKEGRRWRDVRSDDINEYIKDVIGTEFSAKDFRTWSGTVLAAAALAGEDKPASETAAQRTINRAVKTVAAALGNTPAVCRRSYIDPRVLDRYRDGETIDLGRRAGREGDDVGADPAADRAPGPRADRLSPAGDGVRMRPWT